MFSSKASEPSSAPRKPTYILTDRIPGSEIPLLLGRIVADFVSPSDEYKPEDPRPALMSKIYEIIDTDFSTLFSVSKNHTAESKVGQILGISAEKIEDSQTGLQSKFVRTRSLSQHRESLQALLKEFKPEILQLLRDNGGVGYLVVGVKSALNAKHVLRREFSSSTTVKFGVPTDAIIAAASHGVVSLGESVNVDVSAGRGRSTGVESAGRTEGEQVFAVRYRVLTLKKPFLSKQGAYVDYGSVKQVGFEDGVYGVTKGEREEISEDEDEGDDDGDEDEFDDEDIDLAQEVAGSEMKKRGDEVVGLRFEE